MSSTFLQIQSADVVAQDIDVPRRILRLEAGTDVSFSVTATTNMLTAQISAGAGSGSNQTTVLSSSTSFKRRDGVVVAGAFVYNASDYTGSKTMRAVLASMNGSVVRARIFDFSDSSYVSSAALTTASASPTVLQSTSLTLGSSDKLYELHVDVTGAGDINHEGVCSYCEIKSA